MADRLIRPGPAEAPLRILMVCMTYPLGAGDSYLTTELAEALAQAGHHVEVLHLDWHGAADGAVEERRSASGIRVVRCAPRQWRGLGALAAYASKFLLGGRAAARAARDHFVLEGFDVLIGWMPALAIAPLVGRAEAAGIAHRLLFVWDFFPDHHHQIGRIPGGPPLWIARALERRLVRRFTAILCTLPGNAAYLRRHYPLRPGQNVLVTPVWSVTTPLAAVDRAAVRARHALPPDRPIAVFGGQLVEGRGFEQMLAAAEAGAALGSPLLYLFVGNGRSADRVRDRAAGSANVAWRPPVPREDYLALLGGCDVGLVATVPGVTSFSIPSKTIDYLRAGLPVVAALEPGNDLVEVLERYDVGVAVPFGAAGDFHAAAERLASDAPARAAARFGAARCLDQFFDVRHAVAAVMQAVAGAPAAPAAARAAGRRG